MSFADFSRWLGSGKFGFRIKDWVSRDVLGIVIRTEDPRGSTKFMKQRWADKELGGVEIGTCEGYNADSILRNLNIKKLYVVDPYCDYEELEPGENPPLDWAEVKAHKKLDKYGDKLVWVKKYSEQAAKDIPNGLDFVYIDGNHSYEFVKKDIEIYYKKLRRGGVLAGHDIENGLCIYRDGVVKAVLEFVNKNKLTLFIHAPDWWVFRK